MHQHLTANRKGALTHHLLMGFSPFPFPGWVNPYSAGINFRRQILTSKVDPHTVRVNIFLLAVDP